VTIVNANLRYDIDNAEALAEVLADHAEHTMTPRAAEALLADVEARTNLTNRRVTWVQEQNSWQVTGTAPSGTLIIGVLAPGERRTIIRYGEPHIPGVIV